MENARSAPQLPELPVAALPAPELIPPESDGGFPLWAALLALLLIVMGVGTLVFRRRRAFDDVQTPEIATVPLSPRLPTPAKRSGTRLPGQLPAQPLEPVAPAVPAAPAPAGPSRIDMNFEPLKVRLSAEGLVVAFRLTLSNICNEIVTDVSVNVAMRSADGSAIQAPARTNLPSMFFDALRPGDAAVHEGEVRLGTQSFHPIPADGAQMLLPIVDLFPRYTDAQGGLHELHLPVLIGQEHRPQTAKIAPFRLGAAIAPHRAIGCRILQMPSGARPVN